MRRSGGEEWERRRDEKKEREGVGGEGGVRRERKDLFQECRIHGGGGGGIQSEVLVLAIRNVLAGVEVEGEPGSSVAFENVGLIFEAEERREGESESECEIKGG